LVFRDRFAWQGPWDLDQAAWHFGSHLACGSLFVTGPVEDSVLTNESTCQPAVFRTGANDTCLRCLGSSEEITRELVTTTLKSAGNLCGGESSSPWLLPFQDLAPNHWFVPAHCPRDTVPNLEQEMGMPGGSGRPATSNS
jgi:urease accessory protein